MNGNRARRQRPFVGQGGLPVAKGKVRGHWLGKERERDIERRGGGPKRSKSLVGIGGASVRTMRARENSTTGDVVRVRRNEFAGGQRKKKTLP